MTTFVLIVLIALVCYLVLVVNNLKNQVENFIDFIEEDCDTESNVLVKKVTDSVSEKLESLLSNNITYEGIDALIKKVCDLNITVKAIDAKLCVFIEKDANRYKCWIEDIQEIKKVANVNNNIIKEKHNRVMSSIENVNKNINENINEIATKLNENDVLILGDITTNMNLIKEVKESIKSKAKNSSSTKSKSVNKQTVENKSES